MLITSRSGGCDLCTFSVLLIRHCILLVQMCEERGLYFDTAMEESKSTAEMSARLNAWIKISTQFRGEICFSLIMS